MYITHHKTLFDRSLQFPPLSPPAGRFKMFSVFRRPSGNLGSVRKRPAVAGSREEGRDGLAASCSSGRSRAGGENTRPSAVAGQIELGICNENGPVYAFLCAPLRLLLPAPSPAPLTSAVTTHTADRKGSSIVPFILVLL